FRENPASWPFPLVPFQLIASNFGEPRGKPLFEVAPPSTRLQVTFTPPCIVDAQTTLIVDQSQRPPIGGGAHLPLVVLLQAFAQIACAADVESPILVTQQDVGVFHQSSQQFGSKSWNGTKLPHAALRSDRAAPPSSPDRSRKTIPPPSRASATSPLHSSAS